MTNSIPTSHLYHNSECIKIVTLPVLWLALLCVVQLLCASPLIPVSAVAFVQSAFQLWEHRGVEGGCLSVYQKAQTRALWNG